MEIFWTSYYLIDFKKDSSIHEKTRKVLKNDKTVTSRVF